VALVNRTVLAYGPTAEVFTAENIDMAFGGVLRHVKFSSNGHQKELPQIEPVETVGAVS